MNSQPPRSPIDLTNVETLALAAVREASLIAHSLAATIQTTRVVRKADDSPVTIADFAVQCWIAHRLTATAIPLIGEESAEGLAAAGPEILESVHAALPSGQRPRHPSELLLWLNRATRVRSAPSSCWWLLDPIDGTKGFLRGGQYAICLALVREGTPVFGLLGCPALPQSGVPLGNGGQPAGVLLLGHRNSGAWQRSLAEEAAWQAIQCSDSGPGGAQVRVCESRDVRHARRGLLDRSLEGLGASAAPVRIDSQCKYALVARGDADVYARLPRDPTYVEKTWDHAAGAVIAEAAGARVSDLDGRPLDFSQGVALVGRGLLVATPGWHTALLDELRNAG